MSEKVTFRELIESIAEESDNSKQFTHDFLKDFVDVINGGLEQDGNVNIAGFGKFKLRRVDEREGFNPQTEEKMTIPAHNKIIFKPYKDVRELVNAPYAHLEPELIEEDDDDQEDSDTISSTEENAQQDDFMPTAPPTEHEDPFGFGNTTSKSSSSFTLEDEDTESEQKQQEDEDDVVEFQGDTSAEEEAAVDQELSKFIGESDSSEDENKTSSDSDTEQEPSEEEEITASDDEQDGADSPYAPNPEQDKNSSDKDTDEDKSKEETVPKAPAFDQNMPRRNRDSSLPLIAAAASILLLLVAGAWYFGFFTSGDSPQMAPQQEITSSEAPQQDNIQQQENSATETKNDQQQSSQQPNQQATPQSQQNTQANSKATASQNDTEEHAIAEGQTLWSIAEDKYGNPRLWPWIYGKNGSLANPDVIIAGQSLDVPLPSGPRNRLNASDSVGVAKGYLATYQWYKNNSSSKAKNHLWGAKLYHNNIRDLADIPIDKADLSYANNAR